jgi:hypothetical protein
VSNPVRTQPCEFCPYRRDTPSGVWSAEEYEKLRDYDKPTGEQPFATFQCHATPDFYCHGWAVVHGAQEGPHALLAFRIWPPTGNVIPDPAVPLFGSGGEAADHGERDIDNPDPAAFRAVVKLMNRYERLHGAGDDDE